MKRLQTLKCFTLLFIIMIMNSMNIMGQTTVVFDFTNSEWLEQMGIRLPNKSAGTNISGDTISYQHVSMTTTDGSSTKARIWNSDGEYDLRIYKGGGSVTFYAPQNCKITCVEFTGTIKLSGISNKSWSGEEDSITFTASETNYIETATITYSGTVEETEKLPAALSFSENAIEMAVGATQTVEFSKATTADVTFSSSNEGVATYNAQTATIIAVGAGTAIITAITETNEQYEAGEASITVNVTKSLENDTIFYESFDTNDGKGGNNGGWSGSVAANDIESDNADWTFNKGYGGDKCIKLGTTSVKGHATTPSLGYYGTAQLTFKAGAWETNSEKTDITVSIVDGDNVVEDTIISMVKGKFSDYQLTLTGLTAASKIKFSAINESYNRFFLDEVKIMMLNAQLSETSTTMPANTEVTDVTLQRTFNANKWNPVCLPFAISPEQITELFGNACEVAEYIGDEVNGDNVTVKFRKRTSGMEANTPYLVYPLENVTEAKFYAVAIKATEYPEVTGTVFDFVGNYTNQVKGSSVIQKGDYIVSGGVFKPANGGNGIKAFRSYLRKRQDSNAKSLRMVIEDVVSGIEIITTECIEEQQPIYHDLQGRRVSNPAKGLYIVNGKKVIIK